MEDLQFDDKPQRSKAMSWFLGCLVALVAFAVLCAGGSWLMCGSIVDWGVEALHDVFVEAVEESDMNEEDIASIKNDLGRLKDAFLEDRVQQEQLQGFEKDFQKILGLGFCKFMDTTVLPESGMDGEELESSRRTVQRFGRGIQEGSLRVDRDLQRVDLNQDDGEWNLEDLRDAVATMQAAVERENIPDEPFDIDVAGEFTRLVDSLVSE